MSEAKRYNLRPMIDGDNVMDWPRDLRRGPYVVIATDYDDLLARCEAVEARLAEAHDLLALAAGVALLPSGVPALPLAIRERIAAWLRSQEPHRFQPQPRRLT